MERKLASVKRITELRPIHGADMIECAIIGGGWPVVVKRDVHEVGELVCYLEIDSWCPTTIAPFLSKGKEPREFNGVKGERLRTVRLRGCVSQGLVLPLHLGKFYEEGQDLTDEMGVQKWEMPVNLNLQGQARGNFPSFIRKTDQERIQNLNGMVCWDDEYEITTKLDGSSMTLWFWNGERGVCSRNIDLKLDQEGNAFVEMALKIHGRMEWPQGIAIQGELMGPKIQGNRENITEYDFFVFDIFDIEKQEYFTPQHRGAFCDDYGLNHVPVLATGKLSDWNITSIETALVAAEGKSLNHPVREGIVCKRMDGTFSFKAIANSFLLAEK